MTIYQKTRYYTTMNKTYQQDPIRSAPKTEPTMSSNPTEAESLPAGAYTEIGGVLFRLNGTGRGHRRAPAPRSEFDRLKTVNGKLLAALRTMVDHASKMYPHFESHRGKDHKFQLMVLLDDIARSHAVLSELALGEVHAELKIMDRRLGKENWSESLTAGAYTEQDGVTL